jgi:hypothetical protein
MANDLGIKNTTNTHEDGLPNRPEMKFLYCNECSQRVDVCNDGGCVDGKRGPGWRNK